MNQDQRPDPEALLKAVERKEAQAAKGKLRIFFGLAAGVGKTYSMLKAAQERLKEGVDVVIGVVETHGRAETEALLAGLPLIHSDCGSGRELVGEGNERGILVPNPAGPPLELGHEQFLQAIWVRDQPNKAELVAAMERVITDRPAWQAKRLAICSYAREYFNAHRLAELYCRMYDQIASRRTG